MRTVRDLMDLSGRVALITGGAGHIGSAIAEALAECGADILLLDSSSRCIGRAVALHELYAVGAFAYLYDLSSEETPREVVADLMERAGRLDILVNCAGITAAPAGLDVPFEQQSLEAWDACMAVNLRAAFALTQACTPMLRASGHGSVINVSSIYGMVGPDWSLYEGTDMANSVAYAASKAGLLGMTRWLATTLAPEIRVNAISPGGVIRGQEGRFLERYWARTPLKRMATEEDFKGVAAFLASDASAYVTGQNIAVEGGWTAW